MTMLQSDRLLAAFVAFAMSLASLGGTLIIMDSINPPPGVSAAPLIQQRLA